MPVLISVDIDFLYPNLKMFRIYVAKTRKFSYISCIHLIFLCFYFFVSIPKRVENRWMLLSRTLNYGKLPDQRGDLWITPQAPEGLIQTNKIAQGRVKWFLFIKQKHCFVILETDILFISEVVCYFLKDVVFFRIVILKKISPNQLQKRCGNPLFQKKMMSFEFDPFLVIGWPYQSSLWRKLKKGPIHRCQNAWWSSYTWDV